MTHVNSQSRVSQSQVDAPARHDRAPAKSPSLFLQPRRKMRFGVRDLVTHSPVFGVVVEASTAGLRLESHAALAVGGRYVFRLTYGARFLSVPGRVVWSALDRFEPRSSGCRPIFHAGIALDTRTVERAWRTALATRAGVAVGA